MAIVIPASRILLAYKDYLLDSPTITGTGWADEVIPGGGGGEMPGGGMEELPGGPGPGGGPSTVLNVANTQYSNSALANTNATSISLDLGGQLTVGIITIPKHSMGTNSTWRVRTSNNPLLLTDPGATPVGGIAYDSGVRGVWPDLTDLLDLPYSEYLEWAGSLTNTTAPPASISDIDSRVRYVHISLVDPDSTSFQVYKLTVGPYWRPTGGVSANWSVGYKAKGATHKRLPGGGVFSEDRARYKQLRFTCKTLSEVEVFSQVAEIDKNNATATPWVVLLDPSDTHNLHRLFMYGTNSRIFPAKNIKYGYFSKTYTIDEWL